MPTDNSNTSAARLKTLVTVFLVWTVAMGFSFAVMFYFLIPWEVFTENHFEDESYFVIDGGLCFQAAEREEPVNPSRFTTTSKSSGSSQGLNYKIRYAVDEQSSPKREQTIEFEFAFAFKKKE